MTIEAVLFDKDGTLFDFVTAWADFVDDMIAVLTEDVPTRRKLAEIGGYDPIGRVFLPGAPLVAATNRRVAELWAPHLGAISADAIEAMGNEASIALTDSNHLVPACPDLPALLRELRGLGLSLGIATHDSEEAARQQVAAVGALDLFDFIAGYDSGLGHKPEPGMLHSFGKHVGAAPAAIAMVGDSVGDLAMVGSAGAGLAVGVLTGPADHAHLAPHADHVIASIAELPALLSRLSRDAPEKRQSRRPQSR